MNIETANTLAALSYLITKQQLTPAEIQALIKTTIPRNKMKAFTMITEGFTARQVYVLEQLLECDRTATSISASIGGNVLSKVSITAIVDDLEARGLVERKRSKADRRQIFISITQAGREVLGE
jgi:DNA-binding MarR family transcriptional regulator